MRHNRRGIVSPLLRAATLSLVLLVVSVGAEMEASVVVQVTSPSGSVTIGEAQDYASLEWGNPWDMSDTLDVRQLDSPHCVWPNHFTSHTPCKEGVWCGKVLPDVSNPDLFLLHPGYSGALAVGRMGPLRPIDAEYYTQITFRMYLDSVDAGEPGWQLLWTDGSVADIGGEPGRYGSSHLFKVYPGWNVYSVDLGVYRNGVPPDSRGNLPWSGQLTGLRLDPGLTTMNNKVVKLDWVRLTAPESRPVSWNARGVEGPVNIFLESEAGIDALRLYEIVQGDGAEWTKPLSIQASSGYQDIPASLPSGRWYVRVEAGGVLSAPAGPWDVRKVPILRFLKPGPTSGREYAEAELGNPWDFTTAEDAYSHGGITDPRFEGGVLSATSLDQYPRNDCNGVWEDPYINLLDDAYWDGHSDPAIDSSKYRYLTFRLKLEGIPDISYGWVARVVWSGFEFRDCGITNDIPLHQGWNEVSLDLWDQNILDDEDPCQSPWQSRPERRQIRIDPLESPEPIAFELDDVKLTTSNTASQGSAFTVRYELEVSGTVTPTFYYDDDSDPDNGRTIAREVVPDRTNPEGIESIYLPLVVNGFSRSMGGFTFVWDLTDVDPGSYYLSATLDDGHSEVTWYSDTPVIVTPQ